MKKRRLASAAALLALVLLCCLAAAGLRQPADAAALPGLQPASRTLLRIWLTDAPGGGQAWLTAQLHAFEKAYPGVSTYLRTVPAQELSAEDAIAPDVVLFMPAGITQPQEHLLPLSGEMAQRDGLLREELLRSGRWRGCQYGLPLCWGAWTLAVSGALEPEAAQTPAPTSLLGKPATSPSLPGPTPDFPLAQLRETGGILQSPGGAPLFTLGQLLDERPSLPQDFASLSSAAVYDAFRRRQCAAAMVTTGQCAALDALAASDSGFPFRVMTAEEIITDQVWLAGVTPDAPPEAALLLSFLTALPAQRALAEQSLHTVRTDLTLYAAGTPFLIEDAARHSLSAINAYLPAETVQAAAWQFFQGRESLSDALLPLL